MTAFPTFPRTRDGDLAAAIYYRVRADQLEANAAAADSRGTALRAAAEDPAQPIPVRDAMLAAARLREDEAGVWHRGAEQLREYADDHARHAAESLPNYVSGKPGSCAKPMGGGVPGCVTRGDDFTCLKCGGDVRLPSIDAAAPFDPTEGDRASLPLRTVT